MKTGKSKDHLQKSFFKVPLFDNGEHPFFGFCYGAGKPESFRAGDRQ